MSKRLELKGKVQGRLTFISVAFIKNHRVWWNCECSCGGKTILQSSSKTKSCGCLHKESSIINGKRNKIQDTPIQYILKRIKVNKKTHCWEWKKSLISGYARIPKSIGGNTVVASRFVYEKIVGEDPGNLMICHSCDNPKCVNPSHLFLGTAKDNFEDMRNKGRSAKGEKNNKSKLTKIQVEEIRKLKGTISGNRLSEIYGVCRSSINRIWKGVTWI